jgi:two-component system sensor histidine kinase CreC
VGWFVLFSQLIQRVERQYMEATEAPMVDMANILAEILAMEAKDGLLNPTVVKTAVHRAQARELNAQIYNQAKKQVDMQVYVTDAQRRVLFDSAGIEKPGAISNRRDVVLTLNGEHGARSSRINPYDPLSVLMYVGAPIRVNEQTVGMVGVAKPQRGVLAFVWETERWLKWTVTTTMLLMLAGIFFAAKWATKPLTDLTQHALAVSRGERSALPYMPGHQMKTLATALENMRDALEGREYVESYVQSLTHELKSPVAAIWGASEILQEGNLPEEKRDRFLGNIRAEAGRLRDLLERLLRLAALEKQKTLLKREPVNLGAVFERAWNHLTVLAQARQLQMESQMASDLILEGDVWLIELAVSNLLQNAIDFSPSGGRIKVKAYRFADRVVMEIEDEGHGVPDYARERIFERFYSLPRSDTGKKSTGLGLCFVKEAATLHRGSIELVPGGAGKGTKAVLVLPRGTA